MPWFEIDSHRFWLGEHTQRGLLIFDPERSLSEVNNDVVALFVASEQEWICFGRAAVRRHIYTIPRFGGADDDALRELFADTCKMAIPKPIPSFAELDEFTDADFEDEMGGNEPVVTQIASSGTRAYDQATNSRDIPIYNR